MNKSLQDKLFKKYPKIFRQRHLSIKKSRMTLGIEVGNGWYHLLDNLCDYIQNTTDCNLHLKIGQLEAQQIKTKYGQLRFYFGWKNCLHDDILMDKIGGAVSFAEWLSQTICEDCGKSAERCFSGGRTATLCPACAIKSGYMPVTCKKPINPKAVTIPS